MSEEKYIPTFSKHKKYIYFALRLEKCTICNKEMVFECVEGYKKNTFPSYFEMTLKAQAKRAGIVVASDLRTPDGECICSDCKESNLDSVFECCICEKTHPTKNLIDSFGDLPSHRCSECYNTLTAKEWDEKTDELEGKHQYDFL